MYNCTVPNFEPLKRAIALATLPADSIADYMWMCEHPQGVHQYKNCDTRNYAHLTGAETREQAVIALDHARDMNQKWADQPLLNTKHSGPCVNAADCCSWMCVNCEALRAAARRAVTA